MYKEKDKRDEERAQVVCGIQHIMICLYMYIQSVHHEMTGDWTWLQDAYE